MYGKGHLGEVPLDEGLSGEAAAGEVDAHSTGVVVAQGGRPYPPTRHHLPPAHRFSLHRHPNIGDLIRRPFHPSQFPLQSKNASVRMRWSKAMGELDLKVMMHLLTCSPFELSQFPAPACERTQVISTAAGKFAGPQMVMIQQGSLSMSAISMNLSFGLQYDDVHPMGSCLLWQANKLWKILSISVVIGADMG